MNATIKSQAPAKNEQTISSLEIAQISGIRHADLLKSIRQQEVAWRKVNGGNFSLIKYKDPRGRNKPMYTLTKMESLYISSKFNDEARAKLVMRWHKLEIKLAQPINGVYPLAQHNKVGYPRREFLISIGRSATSGSATYLRKLYPDQCLTIGRAACITKALANLLNNSYQLKLQAQQLRSNQIAMAL